MALRLQRRKRVARLFALVCLLIVAIACTILLRNILKKTPPKVTTVDTDSYIETTSQAKPVAYLQPDSPGLTTAITNALSGSYGNYGIVVKNLKTGESFQQNDTTVYDSASLYKLWVMAAVFDEIQEKKLKETDILSKNVQTLGKEYHVSLDTTEQTSGTLTLSVGDALTKMITISDNDAALLLTDKVRLQAIADVLSEAHLTRSTVGENGKNPTTTPHDVGLFFQELYNKQLANQTYTDDMVNLLKGQNLNEKMPEYIPTGIAIAHKTGEIDNFSHDAGIIYAPTGDILIVVLSESDNPSLANERIALVAQAVYQYFNPN